ncbi:MAG: caspase family protein, partial [Bacteroidota bacterium]
MNFFVLLVAIDTYSDPSMSLAGCVNDLNAMHSFLITHLDQSKNKVFIKTLINEQATRKNLISTFVEHFDQASNEDCC